MTIRRCCSCAPRGMIRGKPGATLPSLSSRNVDGVIVVSHDIFELFPGADVRLAQAEARLPVVTVDWPGCRGPSVLIDLENAGYLATRHLLAHGHRRVGLITVCNRRRQCFSGEQRLPARAGRSRHRA